MSISKRLKYFIENSKHIINISYKPASTEFTRSAKVIIIGIIIIGVIGLILGIVTSLIISGSLSLI